MTNTTKSDEVHVSVNPPASLGVVWHNPETGLSAHGINGPDRSTLWVGIMEKFTTASGAIDEAGYCSFDVTHDLLKTDSSILLTQILISGSLHYPWTMQPPIKESILDPGDTLDVRHWVGSELSGTEYKLFICFREILRVVRNN